MNSRFEELGNEKVGKLILKFSIPAITGMVVNSLYNIIDVIYIGHLKDIGKDAIAGVGLTVPIINIIMAFSLMIGAGTAASISLSLGRRQTERAQNILGNACSILVIIAAGITSLGTVFITPLLNSGILGGNQEIIPYANEYIRIILPGLDVFTCNSLLAAQTLSVSS